MALARPRKHTGAGTWPVFLIFVISDFLKILLFFFNVIPVIGTAFDLLVVFFASFVEVGAGGFGLFLTGFFSEGPESTANVLWFMGLLGANLTPVIDDFPFTSPTIFLRIRATEKSDREAEDIYQKKLQAIHHKQEEEQTVKVQAAQAAAQRANQDRQKAMQESLKQAA
jgi:hypothetical protein